MTPADPPLNVFALESWAATEFPTSFSAIKQKVDEIMTPTSLPTGYDPDGYGYGSGPMPDFEHWVVPYKPHRDALHFKTHMCLVIGHWDVPKQPGVRKARRDMLCAFVTYPYNAVEFCRDVNDGEKLVGVDPKSFGVGEELQLLRLWYALWEQDEDRDTCSLIRTVVLYLFMQRMLVDEFTGWHASRERFRTACMAWEEFAREHPDLVKKHEKANKSNLAPFRPWLKPQPLRLQPIKFAVFWVAPPPGGYIPPSPTEIDMKMGKEGRNGK